MGESSVRIGIYANDKASGTIKSIHGLLQGIGKEAKTSILTGVGLASGVAAFNLLSNAAGKAIDFLGDAVDAASALEESQNKVNVVFKASSRTINEWSQDSAQSFGLSRQAALSAVGTYGNLFQAFGIGARASADMSMSLVELAADLASFNDTSVDDAIQALRSGLSGETEPLKRFGIALTDARMRSVLAAQGVKDLGATLTASQKATAAYAIIMSDSALAQGDFDRTSESLANVQRSLEAELQDVTAEIGQKLLPVVTELTIGLRDLLASLDEVGDGVREFLTITGDIPGGERLQELNQAFHDTALGIDDLASEINRSWINNLPAYEAATQSYADTLPSSLDRARKAAKAIVKLTLDELVDSLVSGQTDWQKAWEDYGEIMENDLTAAEEMAELQGLLTGQALADGLNHTDTERRAAAEAMKATIEERLFALRNNIPAIAASTGQAYADALRGKVDVVRAAASFHANVIRENMNPAALPSYTWGYQIGVSWANGLRAANNYAAYAAESLASQASGYLAPWHSPPRFGPLKDLDTDAQELGRLWAENLGSGIGSSWMPNVALGTPGGGGGMLPPTGGGGAGGASTPPALHIYLDGRELTQSTARWDYYASPGGPARLPR